MARNYQKELDNIIKEHSEGGEAPSLMLHCCCAPCSSYVLEYLAQCLKVTVLFYNPNISPEGEYLKRKKELKRLIDFYNENGIVKYQIDIIDSDYNPIEFFESVRGYENCKEGGDRCFICYGLRLGKAAEKAIENGCDYFASTLSISPLKNAQKLNEIGERIADEFKKQGICNSIGSYVKHLPNDFKKREGYKRSIELSHKYGLYRQDYCGCVFSKRNMQKTALFIGGTGTISSAITELVAQLPQWKLYLINRGNHLDEIPDNVSVIKTDINNIESVKSQLKGKHFDTVADFICFDTDNAKRDFELFNGITEQFIFISTASAYQKPPKSEVVTEETPLENPFWDYSAKKIECERYFIAKQNECNFPVTIVRPSHTFSDKKIPVGVHGKKGSYQVVKRMLEGKKIIVQDDGNAKWTMTHNSDFAQGFIPLMGNPETIGEAFQITSDESFTWNEIYQIIADAVGAEYKPCYVPSSYIEEKIPSTKGSLLGDKANSVIFDNSKLKRFAPNMKMNTGFKEGIRRAVAYHQAHPELKVLDIEFDEICDSIVKEMFQNDN